MSEQDLHEQAKRVAVETVAQHLELNEKTRVKTTVRQLISLFIVVIMATISVCAFLNRLSNGQDRIEHALSYAVPESQFSDWANALDKANREIPPHGLNVPDTRTFRPDRDVK